MGRIIIGYQGIGKSTLAKNNLKYIDLESGNFWINGKRSEDWYIPYCNIAIDLSTQGYDVFVSSHQVVREYLSAKQKDNFLQIYVCYPSLDLKDEWITKLYERYRDSNLEKDYKAWRNALHRYDENIKELMDSDFIQIQILAMNYNLQNVIETY